MRLNELRRDPAAWGMLLAHTGFTVLGAIAWATFLTGPPPEWLQAEPNKTIQRVLFAIAGPMTIILGTLAAAWHSHSRFGVRRSWVVLVVASLVALASELTGTITDIPFGPYGYSEMLGYRVLGEVPFTIPISWYYMLYCALAMVGRFARADDSSRGRWVWAFWGGLVFTAWDVGLDPAMVNTVHWSWEPGQYWFTKPMFYGMPVSNWFGWVLTGTIVARVMLHFIPPTEWVAQLRTSWFPIALYVINGVMPITICWARGIPWGVVWGTLAMAVPVVLALRGRGAAAPAPAPVGAQPSAG